MKPHLAWNKEIGWHTCPSWKEDERKYWKYIEDNFSKPYLEEMKHGKKTHRIQECSG